MDSSPRMQALQAAFIASGAFQCGFCTPGMLMAAEALLAHEASPDAAAVKAALSGNLCRCTGYLKIIEAVQAAAAALREGTAP
jgi:carbon-monoxide dehydrogenase small subunit